MILDGSFVEAPWQRNTREENKAIKEGRGAELWNDQPAKKRQKDTEARFTMKNKKPTTASRCTPWPARSAR